MTDIKNKPCQICGNQAYKGCHFQVDCCRACAAFYRRSVLADKVYKCKNGGKNCELKSKIKGISLCRYCRFWKCKELGMRPQWALENSESSPESSLFNEVLTEPKSKEDQICYEGFNRFRKPCDIEARQLKEILVNPYLTLNAISYSSAFLQNFDYAYSQFHESIKPKGAVILTSFINNEAVASFYIRLKNEMAKMLMHCKEFADLDLEEKILLHKNALNLSLYIELINISIEYGCSENNNYYMLLYDNFIHDLTISSNIIRIGKYNGEMVEKESTLRIEFNEKLIKLLYKPMLNLCLTRFESVYLVAQIIWSIQGIKGITDATHDLANKMSDQISNELHNYYLQKRRMKNYCPRLVQILKLIDNSKLMVNELQNLTILYEANHILDFNADFSEFDQ